VAFLSRRSGAAATQQASGLALVLERKLATTLAGLGVVVLVVGGFALGRSLASRQVLLMVYGLVALLVMAHVIGSRRPAVTAERASLPSRVRAGQAVNCRIVLTARRRVSTLVFEEGLAPELGRPVRLAVPVLPAGQEVDHTFAFTASRRGVFTVGPLVTEWSDPFGLTRRRKVVAEAVELIVHPNSEGVSDRVSSREWEDPPVRPPVSKPWPTGFEFYGMRDYADGDDPRRIVWRATAKTYDIELGQPRRYFVREAEQGITDRVNIFLDSDASSHSQEQPSETFETAVRCVASLGVQHLKDGFSVSFDVNSRRVHDRLRGSSHRVELLDELARVDVERVPLTKGLDRLLTDSRRSAHNIVITPHIEPATASRLKLINDRGTSMVLVLVVGETTDPGTIHRAGGIGCNVVEVPVGGPLGAVFRQVLAVGGRR
jgi:uncharacterized protein (DUF58 family)